MNSSCKVICVYLYGKLFNTDKNDIITAILYNIFSSYLILTNNSMGSNLKNVLSILILCTIFYNLKNN